VELEEITVSGGDKRETTYRNKEPFRSVKVWKEEFETREARSREASIGPPPVRTSGSSGRPAGHTVELLERSREPSPERRNRKQHGHQHQHHHHREREREREQLDVRQHVDGPSPNLFSDERTLSPKRRQYGSKASPGTRSQKSDYRSDVSRSSGPVARPVPRIKTLQRNESRKEAPSIVSFQSGASRPSRESRDTRDTRASRVTASSDPYHSLASADRVTPYMSSTSRPASHVPSHTTSHTVEYHEERHEEHHEEHHEARHEERTRITTTTGDETSPVSKRSFAGTLKGSFMSVFGKTSKPDSKVKHTTFVEPIRDMKPSQDRERIPNEIEFESYTSSSSSSTSESSKYSSSSAASVQQNMGPAVTTTEPSPVDRFTSRPGQSSGEYRRPNNGGFNNLNSGNSPSAARSRTFQDLARERREQRNKAPVEVPRIHVSPLRLNKPRELFPLAPAAKAPPLPLPPRAERVLAGKDSHETMTSFEEPAFENAPSVSSSGSSSSASSVSGSGSESTGRSEDGAVAGPSEPPIHEVIRAEKSLAVDNTRPALRSPSLMREMAIPRLSLRIPTGEKTISATSGTSGTETSSQSNVTSVRKAGKAPKKRKRSTLGQIPEPKPRMKIRSDKDWMKLGAASDGSPNKAGMDGLVCGAPYNDAPYPLAPDHISPLAPGEHSRLGPRRPFGPAIPADSHYPDSRALGSIASLTSMPKRMKHRQRRKLRMSGVRSPDSSSHDTTQSEDLVRSIRGRIKVRPMLVQPETPWSDMSPVVRRGDSGYRRLLDDQRGESTTENWPTEWEVRETREVPGAGSERRGREERVERWEEEDMGLRVGERYSGYAGYAGHILDGASPDPRSPSPIKERHHKHHPLEDNSQYKIRQTKRVNVARLEQSRDPKPMDSRRTKGEKHRRNQPQEEYSTYDIQEANMPGALSPSPDHSLAQAKSIENRRRKYRVVAPVDPGRLNAVDELESRYVTPMSRFQESPDSRLAGSSRRHRKHQVQEYETRHVRELDGASPDLRNNDVRLEDSRFVDPRRAETRCEDSRVDSRHADTRYVDARCTSPRLADSIREKKHRRRVQMISPELGSGSIRKVKGSRRGRKKHHLKDRPRISMG
jgi:hypothetical protein